MLDARFYDFVLSRDVSYIAETDCGNRAATITTPWEFPPPTLGDARRGTAAADSSRVHGPCTDFRLDTGFVAFHLTLVRPLTPPPPPVWRR